MLNALTAMEAQARGGKFGIAVDERKMLRESCALNVAIVKKGILSTPPFEGILAGTTVTRAMEVSAPLLSNGLLTSVAQQQVSLADAKGADEVMLLAGDTMLFPVTSLDGVPIGDGQVGPVTRALIELMRHDAHQGSACHEPVLGLCPVRL